MLRSYLLLGGVLLAFAALIAGCGSSRVLSAEEAKHLLLQLPYRYKWREVETPKGASDALAGTAIGRHHTILHFGISLGTEGEPVPVPQSGVRDPLYYYAGGFVFTDDIIVPGGISKQIHTGSQWDEASRMEVEMEEKLCKRVTGEPCRD